MKFVKWKACLAVMLVALLAVSSMPFAATKQGVTYTALGDSIAYGTGATDDWGYTSLLAEHFGRVYGDGSYFNLAQDGLTSGNLLVALNAVGDPYGVQAAVTNADIITVSIGGNDLLGPFAQALAGVAMMYYPDGVGGVDFEAFMAGLAAWEQDPSSQPQFNGMLMALSDTLPGLVTNFASNWGNIIGASRSLNEDAVIYVNTIYNPFKFSRLLSDFADEAIQYMNMPIDTCAPLFGYHVVDVYSNFEAYNNPKKLIVGDMSTLMLLADPDYTGPVPLHPTDMGYKFIFNLHKDLME